MEPNATWRGLISYNLIYNSGFSTFTYIVSIKTTQIVNSPMPHNLEQNFGNQFVSSSSIHKFNGLKKIN